MLTMISFILAVFPIVVLHEFGHFLVGKWLGAEPEEFAVGFGRQILGFNFLGANFKVGWIPLGGYVKFKKVQFEVEFGEGAKQGEKLAPWKWFFISIAGPVTNFLLTFAIFFGFILVALQGIQGGKVKTSTVAELPVGSSVLVVQKTALSNLVKKSLLGVESPEQVFLVQEDKITPVKISPEELTKQVQMETKVGVGFSEQVGKSLTIAQNMMGVYFTGTTKALTNLVSPKGFREIMGPVGIAGEAEKARSEGIGTFLLLIASLSFAIGYFNLLPLSFFDGGRALLAVFEQVSRKEISMKVLNHLNIAGLVVVGCLLLMGTTSDILRLMGK